MAEKEIGFFYQSKLCKMCYQNTLIGWNQAAPKKATFRNVNRVINSKIQEFIVDQIFPTQRKQLLRK